MDVMDLVALFGGVFVIYEMLWRSTTREIDQRQEYYENQLQSTIDWLDRKKK